MVWQKTYSPRNDSKGIPAVTDVILVYAKGGFVPNRLARTVEMNARYKNPDLDRNGPWKSGDTTAPGNMSGQKQHPSVFAVQHPITGEFIYPSYGRMWCFGQERLLESLSQYADYRCEAPNLVARSKRTGIPVENLRPDVCDLVVDETKRQGDKTQAMRRKSIGNWPEFFVSDTGFGRKISLSLSEGRLATNFLPHSEVGHTDTAAKEIRALFPGTAAFATPKPERLLERIIHIATDPGDIVLDCFAGSGTTAAVAHKMGRRWVTCELIEDTMNRFTRPRLEKVVAGEDPGGITVTKGERVDATAGGLPEGLTADEAQKLTSLLNKAIRGDDALKKSADVRAIKQMVKTTKSPDTINWRGGGGFTVAKLSPACFDYDEEYDTVTLTEAATSDVLVDSVCANMNYRRTPGHPNFDGVRGRMRLAVLEGTLTAELADELISKLDDGDLLTIAATGVTDGVSAHLRTAKRGCVVTHIPGDLFQTRRVERTN